MMLAHRREPAISYTPHNAGKTLPRKWNPDFIIRLLQKRVEVPHRQRRAD